MQVPHVGKNVGRGEKRRHDANHGLNLAQTKFNQVRSPARKLGKWAWGGILGGDVSRTRKMSGVHAGRTASDET